MFFFQKINNEKFFPSENFLLSSLSFALKNIFPFLAFIIENAMRKKIRSYEIISVTIFNLSRQYFSAESSSQHQVF